jgi:hypothetical protein
LGLSHLPASSSDFQLLYERLLQKLFDMLVALRTKVLSSPI